MIYYVTFEKHVCCRIDAMIFHCDAKNAKEAKDICRATWEARGFKPHQFHLYAHKSRISDPDLLSVRSWDSKVYKGANVMDRFICTETRTWRVNGINKYGPNAGLHYRL